MRIAFFVSMLVVAGCHTAAPIASMDDYRRTPLKRIALTFDDGPRGDGPMFRGDDRVAALIEALIEALSSVTTEPATFFVKTSNLGRPGGRQRIERYAQAGHLIANHTHSHNWLSRTDTREYIDDIATAEKLLAGFRNRRAWFRFPYLDEGRPLAKREQVRTALRAMGLINGYVTVDNYDWYLERKWQDAVDRRIVRINTLPKVLRP